MSEVWNAGSSQVNITLPNGEQATASEVSAADVKRMARDQGVSKFTVTLDGSTANADDFPVTSGSLVISEYNEAK